MAKFLVLENVVVDGATVRAGTEVDSGSTDVGRLLLSGAQLYNLAVPMPADAQRALDELRQRQAKGDPEWNTKSLFAAFSANGGATTIGDGASTTINVVHGLNSYDVIVQVREDAAPRATIVCDVERPDPNSVDLIFLTPPALNEFRVMVKV